MTYRKNIDTEYQKQIDEFIAKNGVTELSVTDNKLAETPTFGTTYESAVKRIKRSQIKEASGINKIKARLINGDIVKKSDYQEMGFTNKRSVDVCVAAMRKSGWEIETVYGVGYRLIKKGGYVVW